MKLLPVTLLTASLLTSMAALSETIRLVITPTLVNSSTNSAKPISGTPSGCVVSDVGDARWCIPQLERKSDIASAQATHNELIIFEVDSQGYAAESIAQQFNKDGRFGLVEVDVMITSATSFRPNDSMLSMQSDYYESSENSVSGANIYGLWDAVGESSVTEVSNPIDVIVMDSSFVENTEVSYYDGRGFSTTALIKDGPRQKRSDDYRPPEEVADLSCNAHGLGVASVINSKIDNGSGIAGVTNNANVYALKVMTCGVGFLSDVAEGLHWLSGKAVEGVTPYQGKPGIINMSLGGVSGTCPKYMQDGINAATDAGFTVVVAAGNDSIDVSDNVPANCENVITIGSINNAGELTNFTNFGSGIDLVVQGDDIKGYCNDSDSVCWWEGTSFSTPLVSGALAVIKQVTGASSEELTGALKVSSSIDTLASNCQSGSCGQGLPDFAKALDIIQQEQLGTLHTIEFALNNSDKCEQTWLLDYFGGKARMCDLYKVTFYGGYIASHTTYNLVSINTNEAWTSGTEVSEGVFNQGSVMLTGLDTINRKFGFKVCQNGRCGSVIVMDTSNAQENMRPVACKTP